MWTGWLMTREELIQYWVDSSDSNYQSMINMYNSGEYMWCLFVGHLSVEKLLKAYYAKIMGREIPRTHDLYKLALRCGLNPSQTRKDALQYVTLFNIEVRYEGYRRDFYKKCTREFAEKNLQRIEELRRWLMEEINS
jgi:HEPN domain-containing protein